MKVCIMCGGEGTRLRPLTFERPKPCIPIVNRPSIQHLVSHLSNMGFREVVLTLGYMGSAIEEALGDGSLFGVEITYVHEKTKLGTAGSVKNAQKYLDGHDFLVVGGDHVTDLNVLEFYRAHQKEKAATTIGLLSIDDPGEYGIAEIDVSYEIKRFKEKPAPGEIFSNLASTGMYICNPEIFDHIPPATKYDFARDLFPDLMEKGFKIKGWLARGNWTDVGSPHSLRQAERWKLQDITFTDIIGNLSMHGAQNAHKPIVLEQGVTDIKTFSFAPKDMEWLEQRKLSRDEVGAVFGVPDEIMGYGKDTFENFDAADRVLWTLWAATWTTVYAVYFSLMGW